MANKNEITQGTVRGGTDEWAPRVKYEGHDTALNAKKLRKGSYQAVGSAVQTQDRVYSANQKTGKVFGDSSEGR